MLFQELHKGGIIFFIDIKLNDLRKNLVTFVDLVVALIDREHPIDITELAVE